MPKSKKEKLLHLFNNVARIAQTFGMRLSFDDQDRAIISLPYNPDLDHGMGCTHGGVIATLLDNAGWFTCALAHRGDGWIATSQMSFHLLLPAEKTDLRAQAEIIKSGKRQDVAEMRCWDADENLVAHASGTFIYIETLPFEKLRDS